MTTPAYKSIDYNAEKQKLNQKEEPTRTERIRNCWTAHSSKFNIFIAILICSHVCAGIVLISLSLEVVHLLGGDIVQEFCYGSMITSILLLIFCVFTYCYDSFLAYRNHVFVFAGSVIFVWGAVIKIALTHDEVGQINELFPGLWTYFLVSAWACIPAFVAGLFFGSLWIYVKFSENCL